tara:strand:- start:1674 stop:1934 length:261 start_codon:yes stop_codon:yes gene_type:complete
MEEKPSFGESKKINPGDLVQWRHWDNGWVAIVGVVTSVGTSKIGGRRIIMAKVTATSSGTDNILVGQELELNPLSLKILSTNIISE